MVRFLYTVIFSWLSVVAVSQNHSVSLIKDELGDRLQVNGKDFFVVGMNWDYIPIGQNYEYSLWNQSDDFIRKALDHEMSLLREMGVNAIRQYTGVPAKWITYIYENYGIYTMLNHSFGRYGLTIDGTWVAMTDYSDSKTKALLLEEVKQLATDYQNTPGLLFYLLGNENNYGLFWEGAETEDIPGITDGAREKARAMYKLMNQAIVLMKSIDSSRPVAICNGDVQFLEIIADECTDLDIFGMNIYRGASFGKVFKEIKEKLGVPVVLTEFGADAYDQVSQKENQIEQSNYLIENWKEIYQNASGLGNSANVLGGFTFQFSDGWWKYGQTINLDHHDTNASWANGGYLFDFLQGENNMNEEWFGICAKGPIDEQGHYKLLPRKAFYNLKKLHQLNPYASNISIELIDQTCSEIGKESEGRND